MGMLNARRRVMGKDNKCPYQRIEYLEVDETCGYPLIKTDYIPDDGGNYDIDIYAGFMIYGWSDDTSANLKILGAGTTHARGYRIYRIYNGNNLALWNGQQAAVTDPAATLVLQKNIKYDIVMIGETKSYSVNGVKGIMGGRVANTPNSEAVTIEKDQSEGDKGVTYGRFYYLKYVQAGEVKLDLIPVRIGDEGFMYDKVSGKLFGNSGEGKFLLGPDI